MKQLIQNRALRVDPKDGLIKSYLDFVDCSIKTIEINKIEIKAHIIADLMARRTSITIQLQRFENNWITVKHWTIYYNSHSGKVCEKYDKDDQYKYRIIVNFDAYIYDYKDWAMIITDEINT